MKLASIRIDGRATCGVVGEETLVELNTAGAERPLSWWLAQDPTLLLDAAQSHGTTHSFETVEWLPVILEPRKILCVGLNYESHRLETGRQKEPYPVIFTRFPDSQVGHLQPIVKPHCSEELDYEGELAVVIGRPGFRIAEADAMAHVAGYSCYNDASVRDWQRHTHQFTPGKNFPATGAFGPWMITADELPEPHRLLLTTRLNGAVVQRASTDEFLFSISELIAYCSSFTPLAAGDVIITGTPGGVGFKREPPAFLQSGDNIEVEISGIGTLSNTIK